MYISNKLDITQQKTVIIFSLLVNCGLVIFVSIRGEKLFITSLYTHIQIPPIHDILIFTVSIIIIAASHRHFPTHTYVARPACVIKSSEKDTVQLTGPGKSSEKQGNPPGKNVVAQPRTRALLRSDIKYN